MRTLLVASVLLFSACKKKEENKPAEPPVDKPAQAQDAAAQPPQAPDAQPVDAAAPDAAAVKIADVADFEAKATGLTNSIVAVFSAAGKDCDKLATDLMKLIDESRPLIAAIQEFKKANPAAAKAFDKKMKPRQKAIEAKVGPSVEACQDHEGVQKAVEALPD